LNEKLHEDYPYLKSEISYAIRNELAERPNDIICRRMPIGVVNQNVADEVLPTIVDIMANEKKWSDTKK